MYTDWCNECDTETDYKAEDIDRSTIKIKCSGCGREMEICDICTYYHDDCKRDVVHSCAVLRTEALENALNLPAGSISAPEED